MTLTRPASTDPPVTLVTTLVTTVFVAFLGGVATAYGQRWLPEGIGSLANSAGPWVLVAFLLALRAPRAPTAALCGSTALAGLVLGYLVGARLQSHPWSASAVALWLVAAVVVGPPVGVAAAWVRRGRGLRPAVGTGLLAGLLIGEGRYGLRDLAATTSAAYWWAEVAVGILVLALVGVWRLRRPGLAVVALGVALATAGAFMLVVNVAT